MKSATDPYEFSRWKSSCGRLVVRTTWVKGVRHVILSDDDDNDNRLCEKGKRQRLYHHKNVNKTTANRPPFSVVNANEYCAQPVGGDSNNSSGGGDDDNYVERVLQWLQKPSGTQETSQKPMSAPGNYGPRRPVLVKTCSIPENALDNHQQVVDISQRPMKSARKCTKNHQKTELHVHMPSVCSTSNETRKNADDDFL